MKAKEANTARGKWFSFLSYIFHIFIHKSTFAYSALLLVELRRMLYEPWITLSELRLTLQYLSYGAFYLCFGSPYLRLRLTLFELLRVSMCYGLPYLSHGASCLSYGVSYLSYGAPFLSYSAFCLRRTLTELCRNCLLWVQGAEKKYG
jgi:hypothetical protein